MNPESFQLLQSNEEVFTRSQIKTIRRVPQVRCLNLGLAVDIALSAPDGTYSKDLFGQGA
jgi:hypothetical protein